MMCAYIDFEANAYTSEIISIGVVTETGDTFYSLVRPHSKIDKKIAQLTGITNEMARAAPSIEEVAIKLEEFLTSRPRIDCYYCYGSSDAMFLKHTAERTDDERTKLLLKQLQTLCLNVEEYVSYKFGSTIGLRSAYVTMQKVLNNLSTELVETHYALDDAKMLKWIWENIDGFKMPVGMDIIRVKKPCLRYSADSRGVKHDPTKKFQTHRSIARYKELVACIPEAGDPKFEIGFTATKGAKTNYYEHIRAGLCLCEQKFKTPMDMFSAMEIMYDALESGIKVHGWKLEKVEK